jgi:hypothetical protein
MKMKVSDTLAPILSHVCDESVATLSDSLTASNVTRRQDQAAHDRLIVIFDRVYGGNVPLWNEQNVFRSLWVEIPKREEILLLVDDRCWDLAQRDTTEDATLRRCPALAHRTS